MKDDENEKELNEETGSTEEQNSECPAEPEQDASEKNGNAKGEYVFTEKKKNASGSGQGIKVLGIIVLLVILIGAAAAAISAYDKRNAENNLTEASFFSIASEDVIDLAPYPGGAVVLTSSDIEYIDRYGELIASNDHTFSSPVMKVSGKDLIVYDRGGYGLKIERSSSKYRLLEFQSAVSCADICSNGAYAYVLNADGGYQSHLYVYSARGELKYEWGSSDYLLCLSLSQNGRYAAVGMISVDNADYVSRVLMFDYVKEEPVYDVEFTGKTVYDTVKETTKAYIGMEDTLDGLGMAVNLSVMAIAPAFGDLAAAEAAYRAEVEKGEQLQAERALWRQHVSNGATSQRYLDMYNRVQRNIALTKYSTAFDTAQRYVWELAKVYDYETGLLSTDPQAGKQFLADIIATRSLGQAGVSINSATTDGGLYDVVNRMKANWDVLKPRLGINNPDKPEKWFSLRCERFRIKQGADGDAAWRKELAKYRVDNILTDSRFIRHCQPPASQNAVVFREPGYIIPFSTSINNAENFFGKSLQFGDQQFADTDYATKIDAVGVDLVGLDQLPGGEGVEPNIYLVPVGLDYMRSPAGTDRALLSWTVVDQVMPLPYTVGSDELDATDWISTFSGLDGTSDSTAKIRRHSTLRAGNDFKSTRLVGRSAWNDRWIIVIPASAIDADRDKAMNLIESGVKDIKIGIRAYSRSGN